MGERQDHVPTTHRGKPPDSDGRDNVCVFRIGQLGDTLVALPAVHRIAARHPGARITLITNAPSKDFFVTAWDVLRHTGVFDGVLFYDATSVRQVFALALACRRLQPAHLYALSPPRSTKQLYRDQVFFRWVCGFGTVTGLDARPPYLPRDANGRLVELPRESDRLLRLVDTSGVQPPPPYLVLPAEAELKATELLAPVAGRRLVALGAGSKMPAKKWFLDRYLEVARRILETSSDAAIVMFGGGEDRAEGEQIVRTLGAERALNLAGRTSVIESAAALGRCAFYLGNDTGTMHLAAVMGLRCVAVFTSRENAGPWVPCGEGHAILRRDLPCSGCMLERCEIERMRCLDLISVDDVWAAVEPYLRQAPPGASTRGPARSEGGAR